MSEQKIEVGDVFVHDSRPAVELVATHIDEHGWIKGSDELWHSPMNCILIRKADPYHGVTLPTPPAGYRLAKWTEELPPGAMWWAPMASDWKSGECKGAMYIPWKPSWSIFAIPIEPPVLSEEFQAAAEIEANTPINSPVPLQSGCKWVKANWALQPTDFRIMQPSGEHVTAEQQDRSWSIALTDHTWQRPQLLDTDLLHLMKCIKTAANALPESEKQKYIFEMLQIQSQAGKLLSEIRERAEAAAKALKEAQP